MVPGQAALLRPNQKARLRQIHLQNMGVRALADSTIQAELNVSDEQRRRAKEGGNPGNPGFPGAILIIPGDQTGARLLTLLTEGQRRAWKAMLGQPFDWGLAEPSQGPTIGLPGAPVPLEPPR